MLGSLQNASSSGACEKIMAQLHQGSSQAVGGGTEMGAVMSIPFYIRRGATSEQLAELHVF